MRNFLLDLIGALTWSVVAFFWYCYPCCPGGACLICEDNFDRADSADPNTGSTCGWDEDAGTWDITSNTLRTASTTAKIICQASHPDSIPSFYVEADLYGATGDPLRIGVGDHYVELTIGDPNGCLALYEAGGTLLTKMRVSAAASTPHLVEVWYGQAPAADGGDSQLVARIGTDVLRYNVTRGGTEVWLGTGSIASTVRFDNFVFEKHYHTDDPDCNAPPAPTCLIVTESFDAADSSDLGCGVTETAGAWSRAGNAAVTSSASAKLTMETVHPQAVSAYHVETTCQSSSNDDQLQVYLDATGNNYAQAVVGTGKTLKLFLNGVEAASVALTTTAGVNFTLKVVQARNTMSAEVGSVCVSAFNPNPAGPVKVALGTGTLSGTATFATVSVSRGYDEYNQTCEKACAVCGLCTGDTPGIVEIEFDGVATGAQGCTAGLGCNWWNTTVFELPSNNGCAYYFRDAAIEVCTNDGAPESGDGIEFFFEQVAGTTWSFQTVMGVTNPGGGENFSFTVDADCMSWVAEPVALDDTNLGAGRCDFAAATMYYTATA